MQFSVEDAARREQSEREKSAIPKSQSEKLQGEVKPKQLIFDKLLSSTLVESAITMDFKKLEANLALRNFCPTEFQDIFLKGLELEECSNGWIVKYCDTFPQVFDNEWHPPFATSTWFVYSDDKIEVLWDVFGHAIDPSQLMTSALCSDRISYGVIICTKFFEFFSGKGGLIDVNIFASMGIDITSIETAKAIKGKFTDCDTGYPRCLHRYISHPSVYNQELISEIFCNGADIDFPIGGYELLDGWEIKSGAREKLQYGRLDELNIKRIENATILMLATIDNNADAVDALINCGADVNFPCCIDINDTSYKSATPLDVAMLLKHEEVIKLLKRSGATGGRKWHNKFFGIFR